MNDRASRIQKLSNDYELLAREAEKAASRYPSEQFANDAANFRAKAQELAQEAQLQATKEQLEENINNG